MNLLHTYLGAIDNGLIWCFLALGVYITFRILDIADMTVDGSFATGGAVCAVCVTHGIHPLLAMLVAIVAGSICGWVTGILHTKFKIPAILAGILTQLSLYSINLRILSGRANLPLIGNDTLFATISKSLNINRYYVTFVIVFIMAALAVAILYWFFGTEVGSSIRATGNSEQMVKSLGINSSKMKVIGLMIANGLVAFSGSLNALYGQATDVKVGQGAIVIALASIVIGEVVIPSKKGNFATRLTSIIIGSIIYRIIYALVLLMGLNTDDLKMLSAIIVGIALAVPVILKDKQQLAHYKKLTGKEID